MIPTVGRLFGFYCPLCNNKLRNIQIRKWQPGDTVLGILDSELLYLTIKIVKELRELCVLIKDHEYLNKETYCEKEPNVVLK